MVEALMPLWGDHQEVLAFWKKLSPPLTWRPGLCQTQFFLPDVGEAVPTETRGKALEGAQPMTHLGEIIYLTTVTTAMLLRDKTQVVSWPQPPRVYVGFAETTSLSSQQIPPNPVW